MRPIRLSIKGLNSFAEEQVIDFEQLTSRGLFGIFGPTGSGKTSILDGITLSLYGDIARTTKEFINANMDMAVVSFEFEIAGNERHRYRVERAFKGSKTGGVTTKHARIIEIEGGVETVVEDRPTKVNEACEAIIGLTKEDFTRTVVLPQGKFSEFLKLKNKDRGEMLERLFNLQAYGDELTAKLQRRAKQVRQKETELSGELRAYSDVTPEAIEAQTEKLAEETQQLEQIKAAYQKTEQAAAQAQTIWQLQQEKKQVTHRLEQHLEKLDAIQAQETQIRMAETARQLMPQVQEWERLAKSHENLKQQQNELAVRLTQQREQHAGYKKQFEVIQQEREENLPKQQALQVQLEQALAEKAVLETNRESLAKDQLILKSLNEKQDKLQEASAKTAEALHLNSEAIGQTEAALLPLRQSENYRTAVSELNALAKQQLVEVARLDAMNSKLSEVTSLLEQSKNTLSQFKAAAAQTQYELTSRQAEIDVLKSELPSSELLTTEAAAIEKLKNLWSQYDQLTGQIQALEAESVQVETSMKPLVQAMETEAKAIAVLSSEVNALGLEAQARQLRNLLADGKACPVCGSKSHPMGHQLALELDVNADQVTAQLKSAEQQYRQLEKQQIELLAQKKHLDEQLKQLQASRASLGEAFLLKPLKSVVEAYQRMLSASEAGQVRLNSLNEHLQTVTARLNDEQRQIASAETAMNAYQQQVANLLLEIAQLEKTVTANAAALKDAQLQWEVTDISKAYEAMKTKAEQSEVLEEKLRDLRQHMAALQTADQQSRQQLQSLREEQLQLKTQCQGAEARLAEKTAQLEALFGDLSQLENRLTQLQQEISASKKAYETAKQRFDTVSDSLKVMEETYQGLTHQCQLQGENRTQAEQVLRLQLKATDFESPKVVKILYLELDVLEQLKNTVNGFHEEGQRLNGALSQLAQQLGGQSISEEAYETLMRDKANAQAEVAARTEVCTALKTGLEAIRLRFEQMRDLIEAKAKIDYELAQVADLEKLFQGKRFVAYMATHKLQYISGKASEQLFDISLGNYGIETDEEGNFAIRDYKNGGILRDPSSLSGGETFMVSLSLAIALSAQIQLKGIAPLEFFFLDEGFGTLDEDTLEVVLSALERLHHERLSIGLISHVEHIKNRVPIKLIVSPAQSGLGGSRVKIELS